MRQAFVNYLAAPFVGGAIFMLYCTWTFDSAYAIWIVPFVLVTAVLYVFSPQINWWWYNRRPLELEPRLRLMLENKYGFYRRLDPVAQKRFRDRVGLFRMGVEWMPMAWPDEVVPPDVQLALAAQAVALTFSKPVFLFNKFEKVVVYPKPFPSPEYPFAHASELHEADGCLIFSAEQVMLAFMQPGQWYNVAMHEYAKAFVWSYPQEPYPVFPDETIWEAFEKISGMSRQFVESVIGLAGVDALPVAIHHYFLFPEQFRAVLPDRASALDAVFKQAPLLN